MNKKVRKRENCAENKTTKREIIKFMSVIISQNHDVREQGNKCFAITKFVYH